VWHFPAVINLGKKMDETFSRTDQGPEQQSSAYAYFEAFGEVLEFNKGDVIFGQGDNSDSLYFVQTGLLKAYYVTADGKEFVKSFLKETDVIGNLTALMLDDGCSFTLICLEPSSLIRVPFGDLLKRAAIDLAIANDLIRMLARLAVKKERREYEFLCLSAEERYSLLKRTAPELLERVMQNDIARYLGITPVALSRIRSRIQA
jgi:CRP-like cAMP-binding protein